MSGDILILADITRWEIQLRFRRGMTNWRTAKQNLTQREKYKQGYFCAMALGGPGEGAASA